MKRVTYACLLFVVVLIVAAGAPSLGQLANSCWPKFRKDAANTGRGLYGGTGSDLTWTFPAGGAIKSAPVLGVDGTIYFTCDDGYLYAVSGNGVEIRRLRCNCLGWASPAIGADGAIYVAGSDNYLYSFRPDGTQKWKRGFNGRIESSPAIGADGTIYVGCRNGIFYALNPMNGADRWTHLCGGAISSSPAIGSDGTIYFGCEDGAVYALWPSNSNRLRWKFTPSPAAGTFVASPTVDANGIVYIGSTGGSFFAIKTDGSQKWRSPAVGPIRSSAALLPNGNICFGSQDHNVHCLSSGGIKLWSCPTGHYVDSSPAVGADGGIHVGSLDGHVYAINPDGTLRWTYNAGSAVYSSPAIGPGGALFIGDGSGTLYCFGADDTPPLAPIVTDDGPYTSSVNQIHASWAAVDPESGIFAYEYCVGTAPGLADVADWYNVGGATQHTRTGLTLLDKQVYYVTVRAINGAGLAGPVASSDGVVVDATPPTAPQVTDAGRFTSDATTLGASWSAQDPESGLSAYRYSIGTSAGSTNVVGWTEVGMQTSVTRSGLSLQSGTTYFINVQARNTGGAWGPVGSSDGITVDVTAPATPTVTDAGQFFSSASSIWASWTSSDNESGIARFEYCVGTSPSTANVRPWTDASTNTQATISGLSLTNGTTYYVRVRAVNGAGLTSAVGASDGVTLDTTPPTTPVVTDEGSFTASTNQLAASWSASDPESGVTQYRYSIGTSPGATNVTPWTDVGTATSVTKTGLSLSDKQVYYVNVIAVSGAGVPSTVGSSDGIAVDTTPPTRPVVTDDGAFTESTAFLHAAWEAADAESGLSRFEYSIGTTPGGTDIVNWTNSGLDGSVTRTGLQLHDGVTYYVNVRAYNTLNVVSDIGTSDGITVDLAPPPAPAVTDDGLFSTSATSLHASWTPVESTSGIGYYEYSIGTTAGGTEVQDWASVGLVNEYTATGLALQSGGTYYVNVRARNSLGKAGHVGSSDGIIVDLTAPSAPSVIDTGAWTSSATDLSASWTCSDPESGIAEYFYAVGTTAHGTQVKGWTSAGDATSAQISGLALADGTTYYISVKAKNRAGLTGSDGTSNGITVDLTAPSRPTVTDDGNFTTDASKLHASWSAADAQSGVVKYEYSIGTAAGMTDILGWTSAGLSTDLTITGLNLSPGVRYFVNVRATNGAGALSEIGSSDGIFVESTPPTTPIVTDEGDYTQNTTTLRASWSSEDPETGIARFEYCIGTESGSSDLVQWTDAALATSIDRTDLALTQGATYYIGVRAINGIGMVSEVGSSDGITVDTTPPASPIVTPYGAYSASTNELLVTLECEDPESGIASYECAVGTAPGLIDVAEWRPVGTGPDAVITGLTLSHGSEYYVSARATNGAGMTGAEGVSSGTTIDTSGPQGLTVMDDGDYTAFPDKLHGKWAAHDPESGINGFRYCIGTQPGANDVADWLDVGSAVEHTREGLSLTSGATYYLTAVAINGAGAESSPASSDGIRLDLTPPATPTVSDTGQYWGYKTSIYGTWQSSDDESGIAEYAMAVGTSAGATDVADWISIGNNTSHTLGGLRLQDGITYFINIRARNGAGNWSAVGSSDGVMIDSTPPTTPVIVDDGDTQTLLDRLHATWQSEDPESGIAEYVYCIGTSPGATDVLGWTSAESAQEVTVTNLQLDPVLRYYFSVKARSNAGAWSAVSASDGIGYTSGVAIWSKFRCDAENKGRGLFNATRVSDVGWIVPTQGYVESSPAIAADGTTYIGSGDGKVYAITQNGTIRWAHDAGSPVDGSPAIAPSRNLVVGCHDGSVVCLSPAGERVWTAQTGGAVRACALVNETTVYIGSENGVMYAFDVNTGGLLWQHSTGSAIRSSAAMGQGGVIYVANGDGSLFAINPDGTRRWRFRTGSAADSSPAIGVDGSIYIGSGDGYVYAVTPDGSERWRFATGSLADSSPAVAEDGTIYFGAGFDGGDGHLYALRPDGTKVWHVKLPRGGIVSSPAIDPSGMIYVGACDHSMYAFNPDGSIRWSFTTGSSVVSSPAIGADSSVVFGSYDGNIYCLRDITGKDLTPPTTPVVHVESTAIPAGQPLAAIWSASDPDSMVAEYTYAIGTAPGSADITGWVSAGIGTSVSRDDLLLEPGRTYYVSVKARNPSQRWSEVGVSEGVLVMPSGTLSRIGQLKKMVTGFGAVLTGKVVTAVFGDCFFVAEPDRCSGIRCVAAGASLAPGDIVTVSGNLAKQEGESVIASATYEKTGSVGPLVPMGITGRAFGIAGPDPLGLYVAVCGLVTGTGEGYLVVDCGASQQSEGCAGLRVHCSGSSAQPGQCVRVCGVLCKEMVSGQAVPVLRTASPSAVTVVAQ